MRNAGDSGFKTPDAKKLSHHFRATQLFSLLR
jgi:hypothetical protein